MCLLCPLPEAQGLALRRAAALKGLGWDAVSANLVAARVPDFVLPSRRGLHGEACALKPWKERSLQLAGPRVRRPAAQLVDAGRSRCSSCLRRAEMRPDPLPTHMDFGESVILVKSGPGGAG